MAAVPAGYDPGQSLLSGGSGHLEAMRGGGIGGGGSMTWKVVFANEAVKAAFPGVTLGGLQKELYGIAYPSGKGYITGNPIGQPVLETIKKDIIAKKPGFLSDKVDFQINMIFDSLIQTLKNFTTIAREASDSIPIRQSVESAVSNKIIKLGEDGYTFTFSLDTLDANTQSMLKFFLKLANILRLADDKKDVAAANVGAAAEPAAAIVRAAAEPAAANVGAAAKPAAANAGAAADPAAANVGAAAEPAVADVVEPAGADAAAPNASKVPLPDFSNAETITSTENTATPTPTLLSVITDTDLRTRVEAALKFEKEDSIQTQQGKLFGAIANLLQSGKGGVKEGGQITITIPIGDVPVATGAAVAAGAPSATASTPSVTDAAATATVEVGELPDVVENEDKKGGDTIPPPPPSRTGGRRHLRKTRRHKKLGLQAQTKRGKRKE
jgi:hypothetical protein